jgi:hypothetical protein
MLDLNSHQDDEGIASDLQIRQAENESNGDQSLAIIPYVHNPFMGPSF